MNFRSRRRWWDACFAAIGVALALALVLLIDFGCLPFRRTQTLTMVSLLWKPDSIIVTILVVENFPGSLRMLVMVVMMVMAR